MANTSENGAPGAPGASWWHGLRDDDCVLQFGDCASLAETTATFAHAEYLADGTEVLCFAIAAPATHGAGWSPETVRLIVLADGSSAVFHLRVVDHPDGMLRVLAEPLSIQRRYLRRAPRVAYTVGPCPAVVKAADGEFRGVVEVTLRDVSAYGVGFKADLGRAFLLCVGDHVRCPVFLPDGRKTYIEGTVTWLNPDGSGGMATRKPPSWLPGPEAEELFAAHG